MNDYVTKPVSQRTLADALETWLPRQSDATPAAGCVQEAPDSAAPDGETTLFDREGMMARMMGDEELVRAVVGGFLADTPQQIEALRGYLAVGDAAGALRQVHSIKGASANVGGEALRATAAATEEAGQGGDLNAIITRVPDLESQFVRLREVMRVFAGPEGPEPGELP